MGRFLFAAVAVLGIGLVIREAVRRYRAGRPLSEVLSAAMWVPVGGVFFSVLVFQPPPAEPSTGGLTTPGLLAALTPSSWQIGLVEGLLVAAVLTWLGMVIAGSAEDRRERRLARAAGEVPEPQFVPPGVAAAMTVGGGLVLAVASVQALSFIEDTLRWSMPGESSGAVMTPADTAQVEQAVLVLMWVFVALFALPFAAGIIVYFVQRWRVLRMLDAHEELEAGIEARVAEAVQNARAVESYRHGYVTKRD